MRIALLTFAFLAGIGVIVGHATLDASQPRVDDSGAMVRVRL